MDILEEVPIHVRCEHEKEFASRKSSERISQRGGMEQQRSVTLEFVLLRRLQRHSICEAGKVMGPLYNGCPHTLRSWIFFPGEP